MKIYTRSGDGGSTGLFGGARVPKTHPRVEAYGAVDELNAALGLALAGPIDPTLAAALRGIQSRLFDLGADLATPEAGKASAWLRRVPAAWSAELEAEIDAMERELPPLESFILPGGSPAAAALHLARTICRRAERRAVQARAAEPELNAEAIVWLNRLGDWLFVAARLANARAGVADQPWVRDGP